MPSTRSRCFRVNRLAILFALISATPGAFPQSATVTAPGQVVVGAQIKIGWTGPKGPYDFISIDEAGAPDRSYGTYIYTRKGQPAEIRAPEMPGRYEIRYHDGASGYKVLGKSRLEVLDAQASFKRLPAVDAGAQVSIAWTGPGNARDFISIDEPGAGDRSYGPWAYAKSSPVTLRASDETGKYVVRYHLGSTYRVIGEVALTVRGVTATVEAPSQTPAGGEIAVNWDGPDGQGDYISIDPEGAGEREYGNYRYTANGNPAVIRVPEKPGRYEIRYHAGQSWKVLATTALVVLANTATVSGPPRVPGGSEFEVKWSGPDNAGDYVTIVAAGAGHRAYLSYQYARRGSPLRLKAPLEVGKYELRYLTGQTRQILASAAIEVTPGAVAGTLRVIADGAPEPLAKGSSAVEVILDASGSMLQRLDGKRRIDIAKAALDNLVRNVLPAGTSFVLRVFGHRQANTCRTDLEIGLSPMDATAAATQIRGIEAKNLAKTPIAASLLKVRDDLAGHEGPATVVLVTDGEETCDGDPKAAIEELKSAGFDVRVNIVGFAIDELQLKERFEAWARAGNGRYVEANDGEQLQKAMSTSLRVPFEVLQGDEVVATGVVNGDPVQLISGTYRVRLLSSRRTDLGEVIIEPGVEHQLKIN
ncbi:MAG: VWA domain-containing protein [bacterium]